MFATLTLVKYSLIKCLVEDLLQMSIPFAFSASRIAFAFAFYSLNNFFARFSSTYFETVSRLASVSCILYLRAKFSSCRVLISDPYVSIESPRVRFSSSRLLLSFLRLKMSCLRLELSFLSLEMSRLRLEMPCLRLELSCLRLEISCLRLKLSFLRLQISCIVCASTALTRSNSA